jgi:ATP-dependent DNA helicase RecG
MAPALLEKYPDMAERHIARWLGGKSEYLKA